MAVGSNTLGLLFKIGVDAKEVQTALKGLADAQKQYVTGVLEGLKATAEQVLNTVKNLSEEEKNVFRGIVDESSKALKILGETAETTGKQVSTALEKTGASGKQLATTFNQLRQGTENAFRGDALEGVIQFARALGPVGVAVGAVVVALGVAAVATKKYFDELIDAADKIGTDSKDDFDELAKALDRVNFQLTLADHALSQALNQSLKDVNSQVTAIFAQLLRDSGPALIELLKQVNGLLKDSLPLAQKFNAFLTANIIQLAALIKTLREFKGVDLPIPGAAAAINAINFGKLWADNIALIKKQAEDLAKSLAGQTGAFKPVKDAADAAEREREARLALLEANSRREQQIYEATALSAKLGYMGGALTAAEASTIEILARKKLQDTLEANAREQSALNKKRDETATETAARQQELNNKIVDIQKQQIANGQKFKEDLDKADATQRKNDEDRLKRLDKILENEKQLDAIIRERARVAPPGAPLAVEGQVPGLPPEIPLPKPFTGFFENLGNVLKDSGAAFGTWSKFASEAIAGVASATENLLSTFILTGKGGAQAFKSLAAGIIASLAVEAGVRAIMEVAYGIADIAKGNSAAANPFTAWMAPGFYAAAATHFASAKVFGLVAGAAAAVGIGIGAAGGLGGGAKAAAGGGTFGGEQAPGTVTINQGAAAVTLGIQAQMASDIHDLRNTLTTASPQDVVAIGVERNPLVVGQANNEAARRDGTVSRQFLEIAGLRPA